MFAAGQDGNFNMLADGVGGILNGDDALEKIEAGASLVQVYSGFIYRGPALIAESARAIQRG